MFFEAQTTILSFKFDLMLVPKYNPWLCLVCIFSEK